MRRFLNTTGSCLMAGIALLLACNALQAQNITEKLEHYALKYSTEKAYVHLDKSTYAPGETVWFKAYVLNEMLPSQDTKTFYIDWIDESGNLLQHTVSPMVSGMANGQFDVPPTYKGRNLFVRGYTKWMLNFDTAFLFNKNLQIIQAPSTGTGTRPVIQPELTFFPEGGDAIAGIQNKIAYKATDQWGRPVACSGVVVDDNGKVVDSLRNMHDGMGYIFITPKAGAHYTAKWKDEKKADHTTALPAIKSEGVSLQLSLAPQKRNFKISCSPSLAGKIDSVNIVGTMFQHPVFTIKRAVGNTPATGTIPTQDLPYGVLVITVFDKAWHPLAERISYINNQTPYISPAQMEVQHWGLSHRARNELLVTVPDDLPSVVSVSVTDLAIGADSSENILSSMLLTSDLKGKVNNPAYYFKDNTDATQQKLDLVMLTNGWRRFNWEQVVSGNGPKISYAKDTTYLSLSGNITGIRPGTVTPGTSVILMVRQKEQQPSLIPIGVDRNGYFNSPATILFDTASVYYQISDKTLKGSPIDFMSTKLRTPPLGSQWKQRGWYDTTGAAYHFSLAGEANSINEKLRYKELENVTIAAKSKPPVQQLDEKYTSGLFKGDGIQFDLLNDPFAKSAMDIFTYLQGKVAGLQITGTGSNASLSWRGGAPQIFVDEMPVDVGFASSVNVNDIAYIKAFRPPFMGGSNGANGAIAIYTRRGGDMQQQAGSGLSIAKLEGYTPIREFYSPKYFTKDPPPPGSDRDVRTTIYWNPNLVIDPRKKQAVISFYNNDVTDAFRVVIQGMTTDGRLIHIEERME